jgi:hypothetical protein
MDGLSAISAMAIEAGEDRLVSARSCVLTSVVLCEETGADPATVVLSGATGQGPYYRLRLPPGGMLAFTERAMLPWGLLVVCQTGCVWMSVGYQ